MTVFKTKYISGWWQALSGVVGSAPRCVWLVMLCLVFLNRRANLLFSTSALVLYSLNLLPLSLQFQIYWRVTDASQTMCSSSSSSGIFKSVLLGIFSGVRKQRLQQRLEPSPAMCHPQQTALVRRDFISTRDTSPKVLLIQIKPDPLLLLKY